MLLFDVLESSREFAFGAGIQDKERATESTRGSLQSHELWLADRIARIYEHADDVGLGNDFQQKSEPLCRYLAADQRYAGNIAAGPAQTVDDAERHGVAANHEDDGY